MTYEILAIETDTVKALLDVDDAGRPPRFSVDEEGGSPLRCCLTKASPGAEIALVSYAPLRRWAERTGAEPGAYEELGPIFVHAQPCDGPRAGGYPAAFAGPHRVFRAYGAAGSILKGHLLPAGADDPGAVLASMFDDEDVRLVHVRAVEFGCFFFEARRA